MPGAQVIPNYREGRSVTPRRVLQQAGNPKVQLLQEGVELDSTHSYDGGQTSGYEKYVRGGCFLAYNSSTNTWAPCKRTKANALGSSTTALVVDNSTHFRVGDSVLVGNNAANVVTAINYSTHTLTLTSAITWKDNEPVVVDAWKTARGILLDDEVQLYNELTKANENAYGQMAIAAYIDQDKLLGDATAILEDAESMKYLGDLRFDDYQLAVDTLPIPFAMLGFDRVQYVGGNLTVTAAMNNTLFLATAAAAFTLPTKAAGLKYGFYNLTDANMSVVSAGSADDIITFNDVAADSVAYSTSGEKSGAFCAVMVTPDLLNWLHMHLCKHTLTVA